jgi:arginase
MTNSTDTSATVNKNPPTLRLVWPQWQGAGVESIRELFSEVPFEEARRAPGSDRRDTGEWAQDYEH